MEKLYYVYIMTNKPYGTIYIGVTSNLIKRVYEHKNNLVKGFTEKYGLHMLVYFEESKSIESALEKEKQMKKWKRDWKINKINEFNPTWKDLYDSLC